MNNFQELIDAWPNMRILAEDLNINHSTVLKWRQRNSIPADFWLTLIEAARRRRIRHINALVLTKIASNVA